ncbi:MAG: ABC transporter permease [Saprospiraceae bacterium]|nr:ABC transporter permease [Saprospiraceae bacterium]
MMSEHPRPPKWADRFLEWYCRPELLEEIQGDAYELFAKRFKNKDLRTARRHFIWDVLRSFRLSTIKHFKIKISPDMMKSNLNIAWRNMAKQKMYAAIKIGGFAMGIAACLLIALFIKDELSYDKHYPNAERIYRIVGINKAGEYAGKGVDFPAPFAKALRTELPEIELVGRINPNTLFTGGGNPIRRPDETQNNYEEGFTFADQEMLDILQIPMVYGDRAHALDEPNELVITKKIADKYYPNENPVGKTLLANDNTNFPLKIGGVIPDFPSNTHLQFDFLFTLKGVNFYPGEQDNWDASNYHTYVLLRPGTNLRQVEQKMFDTAFDKYLAPLFKKNGMSDEAIADVRETIDLELQPIGDVHLYSANIGASIPHSDIRFVWLFGAIALFILIIACINFINLSTARSANRAKEVGLRKVVGSLRNNLIGQFLTESILFSLLSFLIGILLALLLLPYFNQLANKSLHFPWQEWWFVPVLIGAALVVGMLAGIYPAFYLSSFKPINVLKGNLSLGSKNSFMRSGLVVFQFTTSIVLIIGTFIISQQMDFILNKKIGFDKEQVLMLQGTQTLGNQILTFKNRLKQLPEIQNVTVSDFLPIVGAGTKRNGNTFAEEGQSTNIGEGVGGQIWQIDYDYINTLGIKIVEGRNFSPEMPTDSQGVIINQTLAEKLHFDNPIGKRITNGFQNFQVIGVVEDFNFESMRENVGGICLILGNSPTITSIKINTDDMSKSIKNITSVWKEFAPNQPIRYTFLDESYAKMYEDVQRMGRIFSSFAVFAVIVACLGLFALASFMAEQRAKEIGIRKVLGASVPGILRLLTQSFIKLIMISIIIAVPLAWYLMHKWLEDFAYRTPMSWNIFALSGVIVIFIALFTISFQAIRTATGNPVDALRSE